jgi:hypothetical protein
MEVTNQIYVIPVTRLVPNVLVLPIPSVQHVLQQTSLITLLVTQDVRLDIIFRTLPALHALQTVQPVLMHQHALHVLLVTTLTVSHVVLLARQENSLILLPPLVIFVIHHAQHVPVLVFNNALLAQEQLASTKINV